MDVVLKKLKWHDGTSEVSGDIHIKNGRIARITPDIKHASNIDLDGYTVYPGLINSHDHLEMNLYFRIGSPPYKSYIDWARNIYKPKESPIREIEQVPLEDRFLWGALKNLVSGTTTVVHHNPGHPIFKKKGFPVKIIETQWTHSLAFERKIKSFRLSTKTPFVIHAAEGVDSYAHTEIAKLNELGLIQPNTVLVHAIALGNEDIELLAQKNASIVWCPASNLFMFKKTANIPGLKGRTKIALGSDSMLTGSATLLDEMKTALSTGFVSEKEIFEMVTSRAAEIFALPLPSIAEGAPADLVIARSSDEDYYRKLIWLTPREIEIVITRGEPQMASTSLKRYFPELDYLIHVSGNEKWTAVNFSDLRTRLTNKLDKTILQKNDLWNLTDGA
jgi:cytosine/adenosine deaminase-related metal-dependent hydrolase